MLKLGWLWPALALLTCACSGGYPLAPTPCDDFCNVTQGSLFCSDYDPALCVAQCEAQGLSRPVCYSELETLLDCFRSRPTAISDQCASDPFGGTLGCQLPARWLYACIDETNESGPLDGG